MNKPCCSRIFRVGFKASILQSLHGEACYAEGIAFVIHDTGCQGPMPNGRNHVFTYSEGGDRAFGSEGCFWDQSVAGRLVESFFEPHLTQWKRLVA
ncbi:hypothetical protein D9M68_1002910 [compost metagenome]